MIRSDGTFSLMVAIDKQQFPRWFKARIDPSHMEAGNLKAGDVLMLENP